MQFKKKTQKQFGLGVRFAKQEQRMMTATKIDQQNQQLYDMSLPFSQIQPNSKIVTTELQEATIASVDELNSSLEQTKKEVRNLNSNINE